ncbi:ATP-binding protein [Shewanella sp. MM_2022_3]|uniref:ATP-binding protein n=1 Tax=Shewanella sp. MM_2022_3 TaxID=2923280 RepID=UPI001F4BD6A8|nr:ATP-binding protein [Shewanella sp. MM_2022_3]
MSTTNIAFQVETDRMLEILSKQIYDSPYAMVRENVQNSYDAILMRAKAEGKDISTYKIEVKVEPGTITIIDNGIGMSESVLKENFWKAGSSGKNTAAARAAGVIGTFGIGAMANFGVCTSLSVTTRELNNKVGFRTMAEKVNLRIGQDCISFEILDESTPIGTTVFAKLEASANLDLTGLKNYLSQFVQFLPVPVFINNELVSCKALTNATGIDGWPVIESMKVNIDGLEFEMNVYVQGNSSVGVICNNFHRDNVPMRASIHLRNGTGSIMGLRSSFGLAPLPVATVYQLGGFADLPFLIPTAGREALTRESIVEASKIFPHIESHLTTILANHPIADSLTAFQQYLVNHQRTGLGGRVKIQVQDNEEQVEMGKLKEHFSAQQAQFYDGTDPNLIRMFSSSENPLLRVSQNQPRRELQKRYLQNILSIPSIPNHATIIRKYEPTEISRSEASLTFMLVRVLRNDYLLDDIEIIWADITHGVFILTQMVSDKVTITLSRQWPAIKAILKHLDTSFDLLESFTKDLVRVHIYQHIQSFVPSSQRAGLDALQRALERKRELFRLERDDNGDIEPLITGYLNGELEIDQVLTASTAKVSVQSQQVSKRQVGTVEKVLPDVVNDLVQESPTPHVSAPVAGAPILRFDTSIEERLLTTDQDIPYLNNYRMFLALSDRIFQQELDFFKWPHSTQVAWAGRRIVYLFSGANTGVSLYYDIELRGIRNAGDASGTALATTTIVASNRILVPVPAALINCFKVSEEPVEFYVRFDILLSQDIVDKTVLDT